MSFIKRRQLRIFILLMIIFTAILLAVYFSQAVFAHRNGYFLPDYPKLDLTDLLSQSTLSDEDYKTIFLQTGLGRSAVDTLLSQGDTGGDELRSIQDQFFNPPKADCQPLLGWFTREDRLVTDDGELTSGPPLVDLQPGDIILTLSTHTLGWRHGHAGIVVDTTGNGSTLECVVLGTNSREVDASHWRIYSNYMVLRVKNATPEEQTAVVDYAKNSLLDVPYRLTAGFIGFKKAPETDYWAFGLQCSYLVWFAWNHVGYDLDSDGGRLVTTRDIMKSDLLEVVQVYGLDPHDFID